MAYRDVVIADAPLVYFRPGRSPSPILMSHGTKAAGMVVNSNSALSALTGIAPDAGSLVAVTQWTCFFGSFLPKPWTLECWAFSAWDGAAAQNTAFLTCNPDGSVSQLFGFSAKGTNQWTALNAPSSSLLSGTRLQATWQHLVTTANGSVLGFYVDGVSQGTVTDNLVTNTFGTEMITGISGGNAGMFVCEMAFYNTVLSSSRISAHHAAGAGAGPPQPVNGLASCA